MLLASESKVQTQFGILLASIQSLADSFHPGVACIWSPPASEILRPLPWLALATKPYLSTAPSEYNLAVLGDYLRRLGCWFLKSGVLSGEREEAKYPRDKGCVIIYWRKKKVIIKEKSYFINQHRGRSSQGLA